MGMISVCIAVHITGLDRPLRDDKSISVRSGSGLWFGYSRRTKEDRAQANKSLEVSHKTQDRAMLSADLMDGNSECSVVRYGALDLESVRSTINERIGRPAKSAIG